MADLVINLTPDSNTADVRQEATFLQRACRIWGVNEFVKPIRDHAAVSGTELENDARLIHALVRSNAVLLWNLHRCTEDNAFASMFLGVSSNSRIQPQIRNFSNCTRFGFATLSNFYLEWMLKDIVGQIGGTPEKSFYNLAQQAVNIADISDVDEHLNALTVISRIRNTFHNRGVYVGHQHRSEHFSLEGVQYEFNDGDHVIGCVTWDHLAHGFACSLKSVWEILEGLPRR